MAEGSVRKVRIKEEAEEKIIPSLSNCSKPPSQIAINAAKILADAIALRKGLSPPSILSAARYIPPPSSPVVSLPSPQQQQHQEQVEESEEESAASEQQHSAASQEHPHTPTPQPHQSPLPWVEESEEEDSEENGGYRGKK